MKAVFISLFILVTFNLSGQKDIITTSIAAEIEGGSEALDQVLQTQLSLPKTLLTKNFNQSVIIYFELDLLARPVRITFDKGLNNVLRKELIRVLGFLKFRKKHGMGETPFEYYLSLDLSTEKYARYFKQRSKNHVKLKTADSSMVVFTKADKSPEYFNGKDEGLAEFLLSNIEYPAIAKEKSIEGTVVTEFIVETNGFVTNLNVLNSVGGGCTEEAVRLIKETKWQPAEIDGKTVRYRMNYPITFSLRNNFKDNSSPRQGGY